MKRPSRFGNCPVVASFVGGLGALLPRRGGVCIAASLASSLTGLVACNQILGIERPPRDAPITATSTESPSSDGTSTEGSEVTLTSLQSSTSSPDGGSNTTTPPACANSECDQGQSLCALGAIQRCERDARGCGVWSEPVPCEFDRCADASTCYETSTRFVGDAGASTSSCLGADCPIAVGSACEQDAQCAEGKCRETSEGQRVCSSVSCEAACLDYASSGRACENAEDDSKCGDVQCPENNPCRKYTASIVTQDRCIDGDCAAPEAVCPFVARGEGNACSDDLLCDDAGNCNVPKFQQGAPCQLSEQCTTEHCVDGVCCEADCDRLGVCMDCRPGTGTCDMVPAEDIECDDVICDPIWTACVTEATDITTAHCARAGACKTWLDCPFEYAPKGTPCGGDHLCDGKGECKPPEVSCGPDTCGGFGELGCCFYTENPELEELTPECTLQSECLAVSSGWHIGCDEHSDCDVTADELCCATAFNLWGYTRCEARSQCNLVAPSPSPAIAFVELCESPTMGALPCSTGAACTVSVDYNRLPGFTFCRLLD